MELNASKRYLAVYSNAERKNLDRVPSFVQYVRSEFILQHEDEMLGNYSGELLYNLRLDAPMVLGFDAVYSDLPGSINIHAVELEDKDGKRYPVGINGQISNVDSTFYNRGLLFSMENLDTLKSAVYFPDNRVQIQTTLDFYEKVSDLIFPVPALNGIFDQMWMGMTMTEFARNYRKKSKLYYEVLNFYAEICEKNVQGIIDASGRRAKIINILDDVAFKGNVMISPERWEQDLGTAYKKICGMIRDAGMVAQVHTDGDVTSLIPAFQRVGFQGLQGWEGGMDPVYVNEHFPDFVVVGFGDVSEVLPFGTVAQVDAHVKTLMDALKSNRHFIIGPSTVIVKEMPYQNVLAFMSAVKRYGVY